MQVFVLIFAGYKFRGKTDHGFMGFCAHFSDKSNVTASPLIRKGVTANQLPQNNQLMPIDFRIKAGIATAI